MIALKKNLACSGDFRSTFTDTQLEFSSQSKINEIESFTITETGAHW